MMYLRIKRYESAQYKSEGAPLEGGWGVTTTPGHPFRSNNMEWCLSALLLNEKIFILDIYPADLGLPDRITYGKIGWFHH